MTQPLPIPIRPTGASGSTSRRGETSVRSAPWWVDAILLLALAALAYGVAKAASRWSTPLAPNVQIDLSPWLLPTYAGLSTLRMATAYLVSLIFALVYARAAASSRGAERVMMPVLDILQSIPILSFMPGVVLGLAALFPGRTLGLELAAILLIFTSQAWNLAFSFHQSLITIPQELDEAATIYRLKGWRRFTRLELPFGMIPLITNSMMSWAGGWFFLTAAEQFSLGAEHLRLPGLGSYLAGAAEHGDARALTLGILTLVVVIVLLDQLLWRPLIAWSDKFKFEQSGTEAPTSAVLDAIVQSAVVEWVVHTTRRFGGRVGRLLRRNSSSSPQAPRGQWPAWIHLAPNIVSGALFAVAILWGGVAAFHTVAGLSASTWSLIGISAAATLGRTVISLIVALWTVPVGVAIGMNPRWSKRMQPIVQVIASIPATAVFPAFVGALIGVSGGLNIAAILLMVLGTQWYVLFNVIAGAMAIPSDLNDAAVNYNIGGWRRWRTLILPAIFPYLVTGMITATGGAWNASIVSEYVLFAGRQISTVGLGAVIARAADQGQFALLLAATLVMAAIVITVNRVAWRRLYRLAESRYRLG